MPPGSRIILDENGEWWVTKDQATGVTSQGRTREAALENLDEALEGYHGADEKPGDEELREAGIDPKANVSGDLTDSEIFE